MSITYQKGVGYKGFGWTVSYLVLTKRERR